ncbi:MAG: hypothetical protein M3Y62_00955 [Candidatus Dormibacteraeota bacterium]|uniref:hypothetical protein n=1 Tax=Candidatus Dormibacter sp. TaxID=2973982 RepID=UPI000DB1DEE7|nr:hypothetical protein [Candidatus Dormibacteraeota bacterium]PZR71376.1 MAG: hypothetical protein DLM66_00775 [Candidatus Dormibacteraeota bacterium]
MATAIQTEQTNCDRCQSQLPVGAAYCDNCGERTRKAKRLVRLSLRIEIVFFILVTLIVMGFAGVFYFQK